MSVLMSVLLCLHHAWDLFPALCESRDESEQLGLAPSCWVLRPAELCPQHQVLMQGGKYSPESSRSLQQVPFFFFFLQIGCFSPFWPTLRASPGAVYGAKGGDVLPKQHAR